MQHVTLHPAGHCMVGMAQSCFIDQQQGYDLRDHDDLHAPSFKYSVCMHTYNQSYNSYTALLPQPLY